MDDITRTIQERNAGVALNILKGFVEYEEMIEKAVYADNPENRKLGRVGQSYGGKKNVKADSNKINNDSQDLKDKVDRARKNERTTADMLSQLTYTEKKAIKDKHLPGSKDFADEVKKVFEKKFFGEK